MGSIPILHFADPRLDADPSQMGVSCLDMPGLVGVDRGAESAFVA